LSMSSSNHDSTCSKSTVWSAVDGSALPPYWSNKFVLVGTSTSAPWSTSPTVSPFEERLKLIVGNTNGDVAVRLRFTVSSDILRLSDSSENLRLYVTSRISTATITPINRSFWLFVNLRLRQTDQ
jgi:hypothetical protein